MPRPNNRSYNNNQSNNRNNGGYRKSYGKAKDARANKFGKSNFKMVGFGQAFLDEADANYDFKCRIKLKGNADGFVNVFDDSKETEYTPEEATELLAKALLEGRAINICFFQQDDGSWSGNARIDVNGLEEASDDDDEPEEPKKTAKAPKSSVKAKVKSKPKYEVPSDEDTDDDEIEEADEDDTEEILY